MWRSAAIGALLAVIVVVGIVAGALFMQRNAASNDPESLDRVVLVFSAPAEDGASAAGLIALVEDGRITDVSPDTSVTVPGTTSNRLGDAFIFGGGAAVRDALPASGLTGRVAFVAVPQSVWASEVGGTNGITLTLPSDVSVFDGAQLTTLKSGEQTMTADDLSALFVAMPYFSAEQRAALRSDLVRQLATALTRSGSVPAGLKSDLSPEMVEMWLTDRLAGALASPR